MSSMITLDVKRLLCPMPVIKLQQAVKSAEKGYQIKLLCTDPGVKQDIPAWCRVHGHEVVSIDDTNDVIEVIVRIL